jgi:hypothetical protein
MSTERTQYLACFLIVFAAICIGVGSEFAWRDLVNFATMFGGGGVGILTGQKLSQSTTSGDVINPPNPTTAA